jgi:hypothetical protein
MGVEVVPTCPLGHTCEEARDGKLYRCRWYVQVAGQHPQTGEDVNKWDCAIAWQTVIGVEIARTQRGTSSAVESLRNVAAKAQAIAKDPQVVLLESKDGH